MECFRNKKRQSYGTASLTTKLKTYDDTNIQKKFYSPNILIFSDYVHRLSDCVRTIVRIF